MEDTVTSITYKLIHVVHSTIINAIDENEIAKIDRSPLIDFLKLLTSQDELTDSLANIKI